VIAWISRRIFDGLTYTVRHGLIRGMRRRGGLGWIPDVFAGPQSKEEMFWRDLPLEGLVVYDIGAYHGILTLFFASRCAQVIAYEPNEANRARLIENVCLNNLINVEVRKFGVGAQPGAGTLHYTPEMAGGGRLNGGGRSGTVAQAIHITTLDRDIPGTRLPAPDLIKIDIEGWELEALQGARATLDAYHPALFLEMHGETIREKRRKVGEIVAFLNEAGYADILHVETGTVIVAGVEAVAAEGHLYCRYTASRSMACPTKASTHLQRISSE
jgi:FkbM family methyltransferase